MQNSGNKAETYMEERFGIEPEEINLEKVNGDYWLCSEKRTGLEKETRGIRAVRDMDIGLKPTTYFLQLLGDRIQENKVEISRKELKDFSEGKMIEREMKEKGYVALKFDQRIIGCGFYKDSLVSSRIPEGRMKELIKTIYHPDIRS